jgi:hypothetical protein
MPKISSSLSPNWGRSETTPQPPEHGARRAAGGLGYNLSRGLLVFQGVRRI